MAKGPEAKVQTAAIAYSRSRDVDVIRLYFGPGMSTGWPDVIHLIPGGRPLFIEYKAPGKKPTTKQKKRIKYLKDRGYDVCVCDSKSKAIKAIAQALDTARLSDQSREVPARTRSRRSILGPRTR